jgi:hypothetical protein
MRMLKLMILPLITSCMITGKKIVSTNSTNNSKIKHCLGIVKVNNRLSLPHFPN